MGKSKAYKYMNNDEESLGNKITKVHFTNILDFQNRISNLWINQKENQVYDFSFGDEETEKAYLDIIKCFYDK